MSKKNHVLIVEDDKILSQNLSEYLNQAGFDVSACFDGMQAQRTMQANSFDCIVLDISLPYLDGYQLSTKYREYNSETPILMLTAFSELEDKIKGFECGVDDYLTKPFYMEEVLARIKSLMKRRPARSQQEDEILQIEDLKINCTQMQVSRNRKEISLTAREFNLLMKLAQSNGKIVTKRELNRDIWGGSLDENNNTIEVYINFLRKKIDKPFETPLIKTKIGFGYYLGKNEH